MARILVYLWFDVEDYVTAESDEPPMKIIDILWKNNLRATVKIVAEKLRVLKQRGREDVIAAISRMDVGYHLDTHSRHPTLYEYLAEKDVRTGAAEFLQREKDGYNFLRTAFNRELSCFGHPGPIWAPQVYPALGELRIPVYLDETSILNLHDAPYWYCNILNLNGAGRNFINLDYFFERADGLQKIEKRFNVIERRLRTRGGAISILFHLHTIVNKGFWDEVNFARGRNPSRDEFVRPPAQPHEVTNRAYRDFEEFINYIKSCSNVEFITASEATSIFQDISTELQVDLQMLKNLLNMTMKEIEHRKLGEAHLSPAQIFHLATKAAAAYADSNLLPERLKVGQPLGPLSERTTKGARAVATRTLLEASKRVLESTETEGYLPSEIIVDKTILAPEDYLATVCSLLLRIIRGTKTPHELPVQRGRMVQTKYINPRAFKKACNWAVLPDHFEAKKILEQALLQTWTLKPAIATSG